MSKAAGMVGVVLGTIMLIAGLFLLFVVYATNMHMIFAGQYLFLGVVIMAIGGYLIYKGKGRIDKSRGRLSDVWRFNSCYTLALPSCSNMLCRLKLMLV